MAGGTGGSGLDRQALLDLVDHNYPTIARSLLRPLLDLLSLSREACGGDIDKFLIMLVVAIRTTEHALYATYSPEQLRSGDIPVFPTLGTNIRSVAESIGVPRETVRRKVGELIQTGWIARRGNELRYTALGSRQLTEVRGAIEQLAVRNFEAVATLARLTAVPTPPD